jgi:glycosyltransferase involved in cell wall biosynthesis
MKERFTQPLDSISRQSARLRSAIRSLVGNQSLRAGKSSNSGTACSTLPDVFPFAIEMGQKFGCSQLIALGESTAVNLLQLDPPLGIIGVVPGKALAMCRRQNRFATWTEGAFDGTKETSLARKNLKRSIIVCTDVIDGLSSPEYLFESLKKWLDHAPLCILTSAARESADSNQGSPAGVGFGRWSVTEFERLLTVAGFNVQFTGLTASDAHSLEKKTILAVITNNSTVSPYKLKAPSDFRVVAFMAAYNEEDIIVESIRKWTDQGIEVHILENWSTDATYDLAKQLETSLPVTVERFPSTGPSKHFNWGAMLERIETLSKEIDADWFIRRGADEILTSPWPGVSYRDSLYLVDQAGFNCVDHTVIEFHPVDDGFRAGMDHERFFTYFDFGKDPCNFLQRKTWKNSGQRISMVPTGGHDLPFRGRRVYPFKFLLKHYPVRSQRHGEQKIFRERKARWNPEERAKGWHIQYDTIEAGHVFLRPASEQEFFDEEDFNRTYLVERLSGIGILR